MTLFGTLVSARLETGASKQNSSAAETFIMMLFQTEKDGTHRAVFSLLAVPPRAALEGAVPEFEHERSAIFPLVGIVLSPGVPVSCAPFIAQVICAKPNLHIFSDEHSAYRRRDENIGKAHPLAG